MPDSSASWTKYRRIEHEEAAGRVEGVRHRLDELRKGNALEIQTRTIFGSGRTHNDVDSIDELSDRDLPIAIAIAEAERPHRRDSDFGTIGSRLSRDTAERNDQRKNACDRHRSPLLHYREPTKHIPASFVLLLGGYTPKG